MLRGNDEGQVIEDLERYHQPNLRKIACPALDPGLGWKRRRAEATCDNWSMLNKATRTLDRSPPC